jgi:class 3 adenylate cyclase/CHAT domain-containing protein/tetratricopeptide (TPR) repeat protein
MSDQTGEKKEKPEGIEQILAERERLEKILEEKYAQEIAILFSDICGYTRYVDRYGDISGRSMLLKHNQLVLPAVEKSSGRVIEVIGDAVMAAFSDPMQAVLAAIEIQEQLASYNTAVPEKDAIYVKIGIHMGRVLVDEAAHHQKLTGDVANLAARIQAQAQREEILVSSVLYERVCGCDEILCRYHDMVELKGKAEAQKIYRVIWKKEDLVSAEPVRLRTYQDSEAPHPADLQRVFNLEVSREANKLLISAQEGARGESLTIRDYETVEVPMQRIDTRCFELVDSLNRANQRGRVTPEVFLKLREIGQILYDDLFTPSIKERLKFSNATFLCLNLDERLIHIPWELLNDGRRFLCERFAVGRIVKTRRRISGIQERRLARPLRLLIIADPTGDLKGAYEEGTRVRDLLDGRVDYFNVALRSDAITVESIRKKLRNFDIVHFAGHADHKSGKPEQSGWRLSDGFFTTADIDAMAGSAAMPALIFSNSCQSARTDNTLLAPDFQREIFGMANSFLLSGVKHYVGTFWEILDEPSSRFALEFYENLSQEMCIGEAVQLSRQSLIRRYGEDNIVWASYLLYGDPTFNYLRQLAPQQSRPQTAAEPIQTAGEAARTREEVIDFGKSETEPSGRRRRLLLIALFFLAVVLTGGYLFLGRGNPSELEQQALTAFRDGNYPKAEEFCRDLQQQYPQRALSHVILGNIHFLQNQPEQARLQYQQVLKSDRTSTETSARALMGLGRIASAKGNTAEALDYYRKAESIAPANADVLVSKAALLAVEGDYETSMEALRRAGQIDGGLPGLNAATNEIQRRLQWQRDQERQQRVDQLVDELLARIEAAEPAAPTSGWSSPPLTVWLMDIESRGPVLQEGAPLLLHSALMDQLLQNHRVRVVERGLMDKLMEELRLGSGKLADRETALALGRIAAARVILKGQLVQQGNLQQVILRAIETETGQIFASVNQGLDPSGDASDSIQSMGDELIEKLEQQFPLRGTITEIDASLAVLDIGSRHGVEKGQLFQVLNSQTLLQIESVNTDRSFALPQNKTGPLAAGMKVELYSKLPADS